MENALMVVASVLAAGLIGAGAALGAAARAGVQLSGYHVHLCRPYRIHAYYRHRYRDRSGIRQPVCRLIAGHPDTPE